MPRALPEWIAKHDDQAIPEKVKRRILDRQRPKPNALPICPDCGRPIREGEGKPEFDHLIPLAEHGEHGETNLRAVHAKCHKLKTGREALARAEVRAHQRRSYALKTVKHPVPGSRASGIRKRMNGQVERWR